MFSKSRLVDLSSIEVVRVLHDEPAIQRYWQYALYEELIESLHDRDLGCAPHFVSIMLAFGSLVC